MGLDQFLHLKTSFLRAKKDKDKEASKKVAVVNRS